MILAPGHDGPFCYFLVLKYSPAKNTLAYCVLASVTNNKVLCHSCHSELKK